MLGDPYEVGGNWYTPEHDPDYDRIGLASWYGESFRGQLTANGEIFDDNALTAAHPTLPLPSYARVTNAANGRSVTVRINDRGPFSNQRMIDVSARAAELLDFKRSGVAKVRVEYVSPARLDGDDSAFLLASYRGPNAPAGPAATMLAAAQPLPKAVVAPVVVAQAKPAPAVVSQTALPLPPVTVAAAGRPAAQRAVVAAARLPAAPVASGAPFDPFQALVDPRALWSPASFSTGNTFKSTKPAPAAEASLRSSFAPDRRVSAAFEAISAVAPR